MFQGTLGEESCVVLGAVSEASWVIETLNTHGQKVFLTTIRSRVNEPGSAITATLRAASALYFMIIKDTLPNHLLRIESTINFPFLEAVSVEESPAKYYIHAL